MQDILGKYKIRRELGRGVVGIVYEGYDPYIERTVAIKTIQKSLFDKAALQEALGRFRREAQAAGRLGHPGIVAIHECAEEGDIAYIVTEFVAGTGLQERLDRAERIGIRESADIVLQLCNALEYAHGRGVVHCDVKPANIVITQEGRVKLAEFGSAKIESPVTPLVGAVRGTASYMAPEQLTGEGADLRSDIYSAGVILYRLLTGARPFTADTLSAVMDKALNQAPVPPSALNPGVSRALDEVVRKAMARRPEARFQTAAAFAAALRQAVDIIASAERENRQEATLKTAGHAESVNGGRRTEGANAAPATSAASAQQSGSGPNHGTAPSVPGGSSLLAGLEREAQEKQGAKKNAEAERREIEQSINKALEAIIRFFIAFNKHVNSVEPEINRTYTLDARAAFSNLKWQHATMDTRKQSLSDSALFARATFSVKLCAPEPLLLKRPWSQYEETRRELNYLRLVTLDDLHELKKRPSQEWLEARLSPELLVQVNFTGNYEQGRLDVETLNLESLGPVSFRLQPEDVTPAMLDELGLFLLARSNKLPAALRKA